MSGVLDPAPYLDHLPSISGELPPGARAFATDPDHYDFRGKRCVKDLTLRAVRGVGGAEMEIEFQHNCWKHDQDLLIRYTGVSGFVVVPEDENRVTELGTVLLDEVLPHPDGCSHEIACWEGTLTVVCVDLRASWTAATCSSRS
ncbi:hypothetical protein [Streptomyces sp. adm13(2018)]|uniref:hypothetical protein n=1 Tax=Streptomyces sp. adm13(2018) TaxID=2479007 RepID=UPI0021C880B2|nr:hypothetical protein [Streptomyces sp. adm13(2018)]